MKKLILVASPPACGKTYVSRLLAKELAPTVYLDKDTLAPLLGAAFSAAGAPVDMDGEFYIQNFRTAEYATMMDVAFSALEFAPTVIVNAPFGKEVRDPEYMEAVKKRANGMGAALLLVWVAVSQDTWLRRMKSRNSSRDAGKLAAWEAYAKTVNHTPPQALAEEKAVDGFMVFHNEDDATAAQALAQTCQWVAQW